MLRAFYVQLFAPIYYSTHDLNAIPSRITVDLISQNTTSDASHSSKCNDYPKRNEGRRKEERQLVKIISSSSSVAVILLVLVSLKLAFRPDSRTKSVENKGNGNQSQGNEPQQAGSPVNSKTFIH